MADDGWQLRMWYEGTCVRCWHELNYDATPNTARPAWVGGVPGFNGWPANCESEREKLPANSKMLHSGQARYCNTVVIRCPVLPLPRLILFPYLLRRCSDLICTASIRYTIWLDILTCCYADMLSCQQHDTTRYVRTSSIQSDCRRTWPSHSKALHMYIGTYQSLNSAAALSTLNSTASTRTHTTACLSSLHRHEGDSKKS